MPLDALFLSALTRELSASLAGARIDKIQMPERDVVVLALRTLEGSRRLLISAAGGSARVCFTGESFENPAQPPMFCMLLRKHLTGARIVSVTQPPLERLMDLELDTADAMGVTCRRHLIAEMMGSYANIILTGPDGIITDCIRRIDSSMSDKRLLLPGLLYRLPPKPDKGDLFALTEEELISLLQTAPPEQRADKWLTEHFAGLSPLIARELVYQAAGETDARFASLDVSRLVYAVDALKHLLAENGAQPYLLTEQDGACADFTFLPVRQYEGVRVPEMQESFSELLETFYARRDRAEHIRRHGQELLRTVKTARDRTGRRLSQQYIELEKAGDRERLREDADILMANLHLLKKGDRVLRAQDFYDPMGGEREIFLDPTKSPKDNAAALYKEYTKRKTAQRMLTELTESGERELAYLESVLEELSRAEREEDLQQIRAELTEAGYLRQKKGKKEKRTAVHPMRFISDTGMEFFVGRNNVQNDTLTLHMAFKGDLWLHVQKLHGSHAIIPCQGGQMADDTTVAQAAAVAAWYSQGRAGQNVPVDYTQVRFVKKPAGAKPGMVIYTNQKTIYVNPDETLVQRLQKG